MSKPRYSGYSGNVRGLFQQATIIDSPVWAFDVGDNTPPNHKAPLVLFSMWILSTKILLHIKFRDDYPRNRSTYTHIPSFQSTRPRERTWHFPDIPPSNSRLPALNIFVSGGSILFALTHACGECPLPKDLKCRGESVTVAAMGETFDGDRIPMRITLDRSNYTRACCGRERRTIHAIFMVSLRQTNEREGADPLVARRSR